MDADIDLYSTGSGANSQSELENLENDLKSTIESNSSNSISLNSSYWYIKIDSNSTRVNINVQTSILNKYL